MKTDLLKYILVIAVSAVSAVMASAQENVETVGYDYVDSLVYRTVPAVDSLLLGADVFQVMPDKKNGGKATVVIRQSQMVEESMRIHVTDNRTRAITGYRIRIFFDNSQTARKESESTLNAFVSSYRGIPAYRSYANPYFKVTVGDYRTKAEAMANLANVKKSFPSAFIVKEKINFPQIGGRPMTTVVDTVKVYRPKTLTFQ